MKRKIAFKTLGCRLNQAETDSLASQFHKGNYEIVSFSEAADIYVVNTCTVTNQSDQKSRNFINQAGRKNHPLVVVTGCMANHFKDKLEAQDQITYVVPNEQKSSVFSLVEAHYSGEIIHPTDARGLFDFEVAEKSFHTRCAVKIQDGCDNFCTFCIIPQVRGRALSRPLTDIKENIRKALDLGYKEMVLTGVNIGRYQSENINFEKLVEEILEIPGDFRVRISSIEPDGFGNRFFDLLSHPKMCSHLHLCLQSGSDSVLLKMRRMYTVSAYRKIVDAIRKTHPAFNFTTDIIVGFPGETEAEFAETCRLANDLAFSHIHTFKYSIRDNTRAARMTEQVSDKKKTIRSETIRAIAEKNRLLYLQSFICKKQVVLTEKLRSNTAKGYGEHYVPIEVSAPALTKNEFYRVKLTGLRMDKEPILLGNLSEK